MKDFSSRVHDLVSTIPSGKVATYGQIASLLGSPKASRAVAAALRNIPDGLDVPYHRIVSGDGRVAARSEDGVIHRRTLLEAEGVSFTASGAVDLAKHLWRT